MTSLPSHHQQFLKHLNGILLGTAVGDAIGLPTEGLSPERIKKWYPKGWRHQLIGPWGMVSDDTDHTVFVTQSLIAHPDNADAFGRRLARSLRWWLVGLPAGIGFGTLRAILKLWFGFSPKKSGVFTAGNGPAMRIAPVGAMFAHQSEQLTHYVKTSTLLTHTDPKAWVGTLAIARLTAWIVRENLTERPALYDWLQLLRDCGPDDTDWQQCMDHLEEHASQDKEVAELARTMGLSRGITGYIYHTVPMVLYAWYRHFGDYQATVTSVMSCGGDTDTTGAIAGALAGAVTGIEGIPESWLTNLHDWPHNPTFLRKLAKRLTQVVNEQKPGQPLRTPWPLILLRNLGFTIIVLAHGFRRLFPPY